MACTLIFIITRLEQKEIPNVKYSKAIDSFVPKLLMLTNVPAPASVVAIGAGMEHLQRTVDEHQQEARTIVACGVTMNVVVVTHSVRKIKTTVRSTAIGV